MTLFTILQCIIAGVTMGSVYAAVALGFYIVYSVTRIFNFMQGEFVMLGGMLTAIFAEAGIPLLPSILLAVFITGVIGGGAYQGVLYPARNAPPMIPTLLCMGLSISLSGLTLLIFGWQSRSLEPFMGSHSFHILQATVYAQTPWIVGTVAAMVTGLFLFFEFTVAGKAFRSCAEEPLGARLIGINVEKMALLSFVLAAILGAGAGAVMVPFTTTSYGLGLPLAIKGLLACFMGGFGKATGVIVGAMALGLGEAFAGGIISSRLQTAIALGVLVVVVLLRPAGLMGGPEVRRA